MIVKDALYDARALIDEYNEDGVVISSEDSDIAALEVNGIRFVNMALQEIFRESESFEEYSIVNKKIPNLIGDQFNIEEFIGDNQNYPEHGIIGAKAYFFTLDSDADVYIQEYNGASWVDLITLNLTPTEETDYKGPITVSDPSYPVRMVFSGTTFYRHFNRCLYSYPFKADAIPDYKQWVRYDMPSNYGELDKIVAEDFNDAYSIKANYKWEGFKTLSIKRDYEGVLSVIYKPRPAEVTTVDDEIVTFNPIAEQFVRFFVASKMATTENTDLVNFFEQKANEVKQEAMKTKPAGEEKIVDVYFNESSCTRGYYGGNI